MSSLDNGKIPANTVCPFREQCDYTNPMNPPRLRCFHKGLEHPVSFECNVAVGYDLEKICRDQG